MNLIENGLVPIYEHNGQRAVNARELHERLEVGKKFADWINERIEKYGFAEGTDYVSFSQNGEKPLGGRPSIEYALSIDTAKEIAMVENNEQGRNIRRYFIAIEKKAATYFPGSETAARLQRAEAMKLNAKTRAFKAIMGSINNQQLSAVAVELYGLTTIEAITGQRIGYRPETEKLYTCTEIAQELNMPANTLGRIATRHGIKKPEHGVWALDKSQSSNKQVNTFRYNEAGRAALLALLGNRAASYAGAQP